MSSHHPERGIGSNQWKDQPPEKPRDVVGGANTWVPSTDAAAVFAEEPPTFIGRLENESMFGADLREAQWVNSPEVHRVDFGTADLSGTRMSGTFTHTSFRGAKMQGADINGVHIGSDFTRANLDGARLHATDSSDFSSASMRGVDAMRASFTDGDFDHASLVGANFTLCQFQGADLSNTVGFDYANFRGCTYDDTTRFPDGYNPDANGWTHQPMDGATRDAVVRLRADAQHGRLETPAAYAV